jgi:hypothetical protein
MPSPPVAPDSSKPIESRAGDDFVPFARSSQETESRALAKMETGVELEREDIEAVEPPTFGVKTAAPQRPRWPLGVEVGLAAALVIILLLAVGWTSLNFLLKPIPVTAKTRDGRLVVTWPAGSTANADETWLGTWVDGQPFSRLLTAEEQERGETVLDRTGEDVIVQLHIHHWLYDRQGMVHWIQVPPASAPPPAVKAGRR